MIDRRQFIRPSNIPSLEICPGKALMEARAVDLCQVLGRIEHPQARQGTIGHAVVAQTLSMIYQTPGGRVPPAEALAKMEGALAGLEPWSADAARRCVNYAVALADREEAAGFAVEVHVEMYLPGAHLGISRGGTADVVILCRDPESRRVQRVVLQDHKLGWLDQGEAADHKQLWAYAAMAWEKYSPALDLEVHLAQGRRRDFSAAVFTPADIQDVAAHVRRIAMDAFGPAPEIRPALEACRYCRALPFCRPAREEIMKAIEETALFGIQEEDRVRLAEVAKLAARFAEEVRMLQKEWVAEIQAGVAELACRRPLRFW